MADCYALLERADFTQSKAAEIGSAAGCPFCRARMDGPRKAGSQVFELNHHRAGSVYWLEEDQLWSSSSLLALLPLDALPDWLAPFDARLSFILDDVVVWFCNQAMIGSGFYWSQTGVLMLAVTCWDRKIAIAGDEMARLLMAHGMPDRFQRKAAQEFDFAVAAMVAAARRKAIKKWRDPNSFRDQWSQAMRHWGR